MVDHNTKDKEKEKSKNLYHFSSWGKTFVDLSQRCGNSFWRVFNSSKYKKRITHQRIEMGFNKDNEMIKSNSKFDTSITHPDYVKYFDFFSGNVSLYSSKSFVNKKRITLKI